MTLTRRKFLQNTAALVAGRAAAKELDPNRLAKFVDPLPIPPVMKPLRGGGFRVAMREFTTKLHRDLPPARLWGYEGMSPGPTFEMRSGHPAVVEWVNELPARHFMPIDHELCGAEKDKPEVRAIVHVHGAKTRPEHDGYPENWYVPGESNKSLYPGVQDAAMLWYHDHAMGITRLNTYAGLFGAWIIRDDAEDELNLPRGRYEIPLILCDRFVNEDGGLFYPTSFKPGVVWTPEVFGNVMLVNGKAFPYLDVEPRKYRFRLLNASNGRFYFLSLSNGRPLAQIGSDQGLLPEPAPAKTIAIAPGERVDVIVDFSRAAGSSIVLESQTLGLMQFRVGSGRVADSSAVPAKLRTVERIPESAAVAVRRLVINECKDRAGDSMRMLLNNTPWRAPVTEKPVLGTTEIWEFVNTTDDSHPIHLHMVRFQILDRCNFASELFLVSGQMRITGARTPPEAAEAGWKDTVRAHPNMITRIIVPFTGYAGRYVWHCHVLEHEDNEMMRPYEILPA